MQLLYPLFYRQFGIRRVQSLLMPRTIELNSLPRNSMVHYLTHDSEHPDIDTSKLFYSQYSKPKIVDYPEELLDIKGMPKKKSIIIRSLIRPFHAKNKTFRYIKDHYKIIKDEQTLLINNYNYLDIAYRYADLPLTPYYKWWNAEKTLWKTLDTIAEATQRNHFVFINVPKNLPSISLMKIFEGKVTPAILKVFDSKEKLFILEFYKWLGEETRKDSLLSVINSQHYSKVNLVFTTESGKASILNLGYLNSWIKGSDNTTEFSTVTQFNNLQIQKIFIKYLLMLQMLETQELVVDTTREQTSASPVGDTPVNQDPQDLAEDKDIREEHDEYIHEHEPDEEEDNSSYSDEFNNITYVIKNDKLNKPEENKTNISDQELTKAATDGVIDLDKQFADIDEDLKALELLNNSNMKQKGVRVDKNGQLIEEEILDDDTPLEEIQNSVYKNLSVNDSLIQQINQAADYGLLTAPDYKKFLKDLEEYKNLPDPYTGKDRLINKAVVTKEDVKIDNVKSAIVASDNIIDKTMLESSLLSFDYDYITKVLEKDVLAMVDSIQKAGVVIKSYEIERDTSALGDYEHHTLELKPIDGVSSRIHFRVPKIAEDGSYVANGNKYCLRKQRIDVPIRKIKPSIVALTSYYGKTFISLSPKKANNSIEWLIKQINKSSLEEKPYISKVAPANVFDNNFEAPFIYNAMANHFKSIKAGKFNLNFDHTDRAIFTKDGDLSKLESNGKIVVGVSDTTDPIVVDKDNNFHLYVKDQFIPLGNIFDLLQVNENESPVDYSELRVFSKTIPVGIALSYFIGFKNLLKLLNVKYKTSEGRIGLLDKHEYAIRFKDQNFIFSRKDRLSSMILGGFSEYEKQIKQYEVNEFNNKDVYLNLLASKGLTSIYIRELELTDQLFVDSITKNILEEMNEPTTFRGLLIRSTELLQTYHHPSTQDMAVMRVRGYERIAGTIYKELSAAIRQYRNKNIAGKSKIDISPYQIWSTIMKDPAVKLIEDINPIQNLKESEVVTYAGEGGRGKDSMTKESRAFHVNDMGIVSEATVDSADVGINAYLSANPNFKDLRGLITDKKTFNASNLISTSALLAPGSDRDDPKRVNFVSIQQSHTIAADGYHQSYIRTGYEYVLPNRTTDMFAYTAKQDGVVISKNDKGIIVEYKDGTRKGVALGRSYGKAEGSVYPHDVISKLEEKNKFVKGDVIAYNTGFFEEDFLDPKKIVIKNSMNVKTALFESNQTFEDSSSISKDISQKLKAKTTKIKSITVGFNQNLLNVVKPGQRVGPKDILLIIEDEITSSGGFDSESLDTLRRLSNQSPRAKYEGTIDKIEVFYHGNKEDMSNSLRALADKSDRELSESCKSSNKPVINGKVNDEYRVSGVPLTLDKAEIRIYITIETTAGVGDKGVFANQMKSVFGEVMSNDIYTESGEKIDAIFGFRSIIARVVTSPVVIGTTTTLLRVVANKAVKLYKE